ncbi:MAG: transporter substrate-binding domain-containing protein [Spirochaetota bacterium]
MKQSITILLATVTIALTIMADAFAQKINNTKPLNIRVVTAIYEPFVMYKDGKLIGFDIDLLNEICKRNVIRYTITVTSFQDMLKQVQEGSADVAVGCIYVTDQRKEVVHFTEKYLDGGLVLVVPADSLLTTIYEAKHLRLGVKLNATGDRYASKLVAQGYDIEIVRFDDTIRSFNALVNNKLDAVLNDYLNSVYLLNKYFSGSIKIAKSNWGDIVYDRKEIAFPVSMHNNELLNIMSDSISKLRSQNFIDMLYWKWFAVMPPPNVQKRIIVYISTIVVTILFSFLVFQLYDRRKRIYKLQLIETYFRNLINDLNVGVYILQKERIVLTNFEGARIAGTSIESLMGTTLDDYFDEYSLLGGNVSHYSSFYDFNNALKSDQLVFRAVWKRKDGTTINILFRIRPVVWMGQQAVECVVSDTTELTQLLVQQEQLKGQLLQSQKLEIIGQIAGGIAHDFNNILTVILGYANLVEKSIDDKNKNAVEKIIQAGNQAKDIVAKLLTFARKKTFHASDINLHSIIHTAVLLLKTALSKHCELALLLHAYNDTIYGDATELQQLIMNLVINAADAMPYGGTITIQTENTTVVDCRQGIIETIPTGDYLLLRIQDTGTGIAPEHLEHIFEPFYTTKEKGSGLGLAIVYGVIKQHKGFIDVMSTDAGTSFYIYLPVKSFEKKIEENNESCLQVTDSTIIIIDDDDNICLLYQEALRLGGMQVKTFTNPKEALSFIDNHSERVALVISDVRMPQLPGQEVLEYIKKTYPGLTVVMMSGYYDDEMKEQLLRAGAYQVWQKMYDINEIVHKVKSVVNNNGQKNIIRG